MSLFSLALTCPVFRRVQWNSSVLFLGASQVVLKYVRVILPCRAHLAMSGDISDYHSLGVLLHLMSRGQGCC